MSCLFKCQNSKIDQLIREFEDKKARFETNLNWDVQMEILDALKYSIDESDIPHIKSDQETIRENLRPGEIMINRIQKYLDNKIQVVKLHPKESV